MPEGLPPIPGAQQPPFPGAPQASAASYTPGAPAPVSRPPGRPAGDEEKEATRQARHATRQRLDKALPPRATDDKIRVYKTRNGRVVPGNKPVLEILVGEIEAAIDADENLDKDQFIEDKILEKFPDTTDVFQCQVFNRAGQRVSDYPPWDIDMNDDPNADPNDRDGDQDGQDGVDDLQDPGYGQPLPPGYRMGTPPPPPELADPSRIAAAIHTGREDEAKRSDGMMNAIATLTASMQQTQANAAQGANQMLVMLMTQQQQAQERAAKDAADREERDRARRGEFRQTLMTLVPVFLPLIQKVLGLDKTPGMDPSTQVLVEVLKEQVRSGHEKKEDPVSTVMQIIPEMMRFQTTLAQGSMQQTMSMQNEANKMIFNTMAENLKNDGKPAEKSTMETIAEVVGAVAPMIAAQQQAAAAAPPALPPPPPTRPQAQPQPRPVRRPPPAAAEAPPAAAPAPAGPQVQRRSPVSAVRSCLNAIRRMSTGELAADNRWDVLRQVAEAMPPQMRQAVAAGNEQAIMTMGAPAVMADPKLMAWIQVEANAGFLKEAMNDIRVMMEGRLTPEMAEIAVNQQKAFLRDHAPAPAAPVAGAPVPAAPPASAPAAPEAAPTTTTSAQPPASETPVNPPPGDGTAGV